MKMLLIAVAVVAGCMEAQVPESDNESKNTNGVSYLCVGMEKSARFGDCPGCEVDAKRLDALMKEKYGYDGEILISSQATKSAVVQRLRAGVERTREDGLFLFFYSGHGGQENLGGKEPDGADRQDEYLCLYDSHMLDDEIWDIVSRCRGRVFLYFDACHSATMYRSVVCDVARSPEVAEAMALSTNAMVKSSGFTFKPRGLTTARAMSFEEDPRSEPRLLCWSGCRESEYSFGSSRGGMLTSALVGSWKKGCSYDYLWEEASTKVRRSQPGQNPVQTRIGLGFESGTEAFR